jgi:hypothetical protein
LERIVSLAKPGIVKIENIFVLLKNELQAVSYQRIDCFS